MYEHSTAFYTNGEHDHSRKEGHKFSQDGLVAVVHYHSDGHRDIDWVEGFEPKNNYELGVVKTVELHGQFKHDGGVNREIEILKGGKS